MIVTVTQDVKCSGLRTADDISEFLQKCRFCLRKPPFYPLNYGNDDREIINGSNGNGQDGVAVRNDFPEGELCFRSSAV